MDVKFLSLKDIEGHTVRRFQYTAVDDANRIRAIRSISSTSGKPEHRTGRIETRAGLLLPSSSMSPHDEIINGQKAGRRDVHVINNHPGVAFYALPALLAHNSLRSLRLASSRTGRLCSNRSTSS